MNKNLIVIGIDIGGTNTALGVVDSGNTILYETSFSTKADEGIHAFIERLTKEIKKAYAPFEDSHVLEGIGIAAPSANYLTGIIESPVNLKWGDVNFIELMTQHFHVPIALINDANAAALGEQKFGVAQGMENFIVLTLGTGFGAGIVLDGQLLNGENGFAGELGHMIIEKNGRYCNCGRQGCLETYVSASGIKRTVFSLLGKQTTPSELRGVRFDKLTAKQISEKALLGDLIALKAFEITGEHLGNALANIATFMDPKAIILAGGLVGADELLLEPTKRYFESSLLHIYKGKIQILKSSLQNGKAAVLGSCGFVKDVINQTVLRSN
jgi:glucokinase